MEVQASTRWSDFQRRVYDNGLIIFHCDRVQAFEL